MEITDSQADEQIKQAQALADGGKIDEAIDLLDRLVAEQPGLAAAHHALGNLLQTDGQPQRAVECYQRALSIQPDQPEILNDLGTALCESGMFDRACEQLFRAAELGGDNADILYNLGWALESSGRRDEVVAQYRKAVELDAEHGGALSNLGRLLAAAGELVEAADFLSRAVILEPDNRQACRLLAGAVARLGRLEEAAALYQKALDLDRNDPEAHVRLGNILCISGQPRRAVGHYEQALALDPSCAEAWYCLGAISDHAKAEVFFRKALEICPQYPLANWNLALNLLLGGQYEEAWRRYESRYDLPDFEYLRRLVPRWDGRPIPDKTLMVRYEQGLGDAIQFVRYLPLARGRCGRLVLFCPNTLMPLFDGMAGLDEMVDDPTKGNWDYAIGLMSMPAIFGTALDTIPADVPYLSAKPDKAAFWASKRVAGRFNAGLAWAGNPSNPRDKQRSMRLADFQPLGRINGLALHSLQVGDGADQAKAPPPDVEIADWSGELKDFSDTAGLVANLDLVISIDSALAHLAGAMGKPVRLLLPDIPDWRWMPDRGDSPWYPTMRIFRQKTAGDWRDVVRRVEEELRGLCR
ncbi:MAG: tetratricopeptide repeat protein [Planctomycetes bacterium]|nr:tetratricopeptide repeat protein [Planctomycetota bacterium]